MIIYSKTKSEFIQDVFTNDIDNIILNLFKEKTGKKVGESELTSFRNSLSYMDRVLNDSNIPDDCGISIEYHIPQTNKRVDFIISGRDDNGDNVIIIELKQWTSSTLTNKDGIVSTTYKHGTKETSHPSYQAWSYAALLQAFNEAIYKDNIRLYPCAYLHNYSEDSTIRNKFYKEYIEKAPVFLKTDASKLREFIKQFLKYGDKSSILFRIDHGKIKPSKSLADCLVSMMEGNKDFVLIDDQKVVFENALTLALKSTATNKNVLIVEGGPGTGKSVVAINLLVEIIKKGHLAQYVTKTSAPREVYFQKLLGKKKRIELKNLFVGSGSFMKTAKNQIQTLIVDEAHRLTEKTGFLKMGVNQIEEILDSSISSIFFIDEDQKVHIDDYGGISIIERLAKKKGIHIHKLALDSQFRCNGSDGYLAWLDNTLQIRETANDTLDSLEYEFKVFDNPTELQESIYEKNKLNNKARLVAGYCWPWLSKTDPQAYDIVFPEYKFEMRWNMTNYGGTWIIDRNSVTEVGCIHTAQGLEVEYIGVIIGEDLIVRNGEVLVNPEKRDKKDKTIFGYKKLMNENPAYARDLIETIIKNTYRTLMTRGLKGCYLYCTDKETRDFFRSRINHG